MGAIFCGNVGNVTVIKRCEKGHRPSKRHSPPSKRLRRARPSMLVKRGKGQRVVWWSAHKPTKQDDSVFKRLAMYYGQNFDIRCLDQPGKCQLEEMLDYLREHPEHLAIMPVEWDFAPYVLRQAMPEVRALNLRVVFPIYSDGQMVEIFVFHPEVGSLHRAWWDPDFFCRQYSNRGQTKRRMPRSSCIQGNLAIKL